MDNFVHSATSSASENVTSATSQPLWNNFNVRQEAENYFHKQQLCTAPIATYSIVEPTTTANPTTAPEYIETVTLPAQSARDDGNTVEQVDARLLRMEQYWAESRASPFPESIRSAIANLRLAVERRDTDAAWNAAVQVCAVQAAEIEEQREEGSQEECAEGEGDERREAGSRYEPEGLEHEDAKGEEDGEEVSKEVNEPEQLVYETGEEYECKTPKHDNGKAYAHREPQHEHRGLEDGENEISKCETLEFGEYELHEPTELKYEPTHSNGEHEPPEGEDNGIREHEDDTTHPAPSPTANRAANPVLHEHARFDWATNIDESIGPVPSPSDFRPDTPPQTVHAPPKPRHPCPRHHPARQ